jgi:hypothetical protein
MLYSKIVMTHLAIFKLLSLAFIAQRMDCESVIIKVMGEVSIKIFKLNNAMVGLKIPPT